MSRVNPPFRADHVGSLLRPAALIEARRRQQTGAISTAELRDIEDGHIRDVIKKQQDAGLKSVTDGEFRRTFFHIDFLERLEGVTVSGGIETKFHSRTGVIDFEPQSLSVIGKLRHVIDILRPAFEFLQLITHKPPKVTILSP